MLYEYAVHRDKTMELRWQFTADDDENDIKLDRITRRSCWTELVHPDDRSKVAERLRRLLAGKPSIDMVRLCPPADAPLPARLWGWPVRSARGGRVTRIVGRVDLLTPPPAVSAETIVMEMHHRTKNNFQSMISILQAQIEAANDTGVKAALQENLARIGAMALVHHLLSPAQGGPAVHADTFLRFLCANVLASHNGRSVQLTVSADPITMDTRRLTTLGMVVNEFIVNALRHAFPGGRPGSIQVALRQVDGRMVRLTVSDDGIGLGEEREYPGPQEVGGRLIAAFAADLDGHIEVDGRNGATIHMTFPIPS